MRLRLSMLFLWSNSISVRRHGSVSCGWCSGRFDLLGWLSSCLRQNFPVRQARVTKSAVRWLQTVTIKREEDQRHFRFQCVETGQCEPTTMTGEKHLKKSHWRRVPRPAARYLLSSVAVLVGAFTVIKRPPILALLL